MSSSQFNIGSHMGVDLGLHQTSQYGTRTDAYGQVVVEGDNLITDLLRVHPAGAAFDFVAPTTVRH